MYHSPRNWVEKLEIELTQPVDINSIEKSIHLQNIILQSLSYFITLLNHFLKKASNFMIYWLNSWIVYVSLFCFQNLPHKPGSSVFELLLLHCKHWLWILKSAFNLLENIPLDHVETRSLSSHTNICLVRLSLSIQIVRWYYHIICIRVR